MSKLPAFQFYPADWRKDPSVQSLSYHDRGVWFEILCLMHESEQRGKLLLGGQPMPETALARLLGLDKQNLTNTLNTLLSYGVASMCSETGALMSRRMVRDEELRSIRQKSGKLGGNPNLVKQNTTKQTTTTLTKEDNQNPTPSSSSSSSSSNNTNVIYLEHDSPDFFTIFKTTYKGRPSLFALTEHKMYTERWLVSQKVNQQEFAKLFDDEFRCKTFSNEKHFQNSISHIIKKIINSKNGNNRQFSKETSGNGAATEAIRSGNVKDFGNVKL
jgi:hypothetical protein